MAYRVALIADNHFLVDSNNNYYVNGTYTKHYFQRFTSNFDNLLVIARGRRGNSLEAMKLRESGGKNVSFFLLPDFYGIKYYLLHRYLIKKMMLEAFTNVDAVFVRIPCILTTLALECAKIYKIPVMLDIGADSSSVYLSSTPTIMELLISKYMKKVCQRSCLNANGVSYVTKRVLQKKYPCYSMLHGESIKHFSAVISNVDITYSFFTDVRTYKKKENWHLLHISNNICSKSGKGHLECIQVLKELVDNGYNVDITFVGDEEDINDLNNLSNCLLVGDRVKFTGRITDRYEYRKVILNNDIFLFPSHSEGLPRVLIETMATGMICVASNVGGIPELLDEKDYFEYKDIKGMSIRIQELIENEKLMESVSKRNLNTAIEYSNEKICTEYNLYYSKVCKLIESEIKDN